MNKNFAQLAVFVFCLLVSASVFAQPVRVGQAGATQLLINSMPRSSALNGVNIGSTSGIESALVNPAGIATTEGTELLFAHTRWLIGSEIGINSFGLSQSMGVNGGVLGIQVNAFSLGDFVRTTVALPDGTLGNFSPTFVNLGFSYAKKFTDRIYVGTTVRIISESTPEVSANGVAFDAGIQYRTGEADRLKLGITLRNVGPTMQYGGDGLSGRLPYETGNPYTTSVYLQAAKFEIPAVLSMGGSYDFFIAGKNNVVTVDAGFISNSYYLDQGGIGLSYRYKQYVVLRGSFLYEKGIFGKVVGIDGRYNAYTGAALGATFQVPFKTSVSSSDFSKFSLDLSYRTTNPFQGTLVIGARIDI